MAIRLSPTGALGAASEIYSALFPGRRKDDPIQADEALTLILDVLRSHSFPPDRELCVMCQEKVGEPLCKWCEAAADYYKRHKGA